MENIEKNRINLDPEINTLKPEEQEPRTETEGLVETEEEKHEGNAEEKKERIEIRSGFFVEIREAADLLKEIEGILTELYEGEPTVEKLEQFLDRIKEFAGPLEGLEVFLNKDSFDKQAVKELFFETVSKRFSFSHTRQEIIFVKERLKLTEGRIENSIQSMKKRKEIEERNQMDMDEEKQNLNQVEGDILTKVEEIKNSFAGFGGKKRKRNHEYDIDRRFKQLEEYFKDNSLNAPLFKDAELNLIVERYKAASERYKKKVETFEKSISHTEENTKKIYKELKEENIDLLLERVQEAFSNIDILRESESTELEWRDFFNNEIANEFGLGEKGKEDFKAEVMSSDSDTRHLDVKSFDNIEESVALFVRHFHKKRGWDTEKVLSQMKRELVKVEKTRFINIGRKEDGLKGLLTEGRLKSIWEFDREEQKKKARGGPLDSTGISYLSKRERAEKKLGVSGKNPISASLGSENSRDEYGAPVQYGEYMVVLNDDVYDRSVFVEGDSMNDNHLIRPIEIKKYNDRGVEDRRILARHASIDKALFNLHRYSPESDNYVFPGRNNPMDDMEGALEYIEALIPEGVSLEDVKEVVVKNIDEVPDEIKKLLEEKGIPLVTKVTRKE